MTGDIKILPVSFNSILKGKLCRLLCSQTSCQFIFKLPQELYYRVKLTVVRPDPVECAPTELWVYGQYYTIIFSAVSDKENDDAEPATKIIKTPGILSSHANDPLKWQKEIRGEWEDRL